MTGGQAAGPAIRARYAVGPRGVAAFPIVASCPCIGDNSRSPGNDRSGLTARQAIRPDMRDRHGTRFHTNTSPRLGSPDAQAVPRRTANMPAENAHRVPRARSDTGFGRLWPGMPEDVRHIRRISRHVPGRHRPASARRRGKPPMPVPNPPGPIRPCGLAFVR